MNTTCTYYQPTRIISGPHSVTAAADRIKVFGSVALIVTGRSSAKVCGALDDVLSVLSRNGQRSVLFDKVRSNPTVNCVYEGAELARREKVDFVIAIGGGSPMDAAKAISLLAVQEIPRTRIFSTPVAAASVLPMIFIPTTAGTGSEVTQYAILTNDEAQTKSSLSSPVLFPCLALLDARYLDAVPPVVAVNTALDALSHSVEGMLSVKASPLSDALAAGGISRIAACMPSLRNNTLSGDEKQELMTGSVLGGMVIANTATTAVHAMGYSLTYHHDIDHGRANGLLLVSFLRFVQKSLPSLVSRILDIMELSSLDALQAVLDSLLGEKETIGDDDLRAYAAKASKTPHMDNCCVRPSEGDLLAMYRESFGIRS